MLHRKNSCSTGSASSTSSSSSIADFPVIELCNGETFRPRCAKLISHIHIRRQCNVAAIDVQTNRR